jgi:adenine-specific DNA-methyltransferase
MNPPFVSWQAMTATQHEKLKTILGDRLHKRPDLSAAFVYRAALAISKTGVIGTILPASFFDTASNKLLRGRLQEILTPVLIARLGSHMLFPGATVDAGFYVAKSNGDGNVPPIALWSDYRSSSTSAALRSLRKLRSFERDEFDPVVADGYSIYNNRELAKTPENWTPRPYKPWQLSKQLSGAHPPVATLFNVRQGARTGLKKVFVISRNDWELLPVSERKYFRPAVLNESLGDGKLFDSAFVFYPYGETAIESEYALKKRVPDYYRLFLRPNVKLLKKRARIGEENWWGLMEHRRWQIHKTPKLVSAYFGDRGSFAWDETGEFAVVQGYAWLPKSSSLNERFTRRLFLGYLAILNSHIFAGLLAATANHVGGGQWDLSTRFVSNIPMPDLTSVGLDPSVVVRLSEIGLLIHEQGLKLAAEHYGRDYIETVDGLYGVDYSAQS